MVNLDVRKINTWIKENFAVSAKCRKERDGYVISADSGVDIHQYVSLIESTWGVRVKAFGLKNYITIPYYGG